MKISRSAWIHFSLAVVIAIVAVFLIHVHRAGGIPPLAVVTIR